MKKLLLTILFVLSIATIALSQSKPILYFCEDYSAKDGEIGVGNTFYPGAFTVMVKSDNIITTDSDVTIQIDKRLSNGKYEYYKSVPFTIPESSYIYFTDKRLTINKVGIYRVFLLDSDSNAIAMGTIEIIK